MTEDEHEQLLVPLTAPALPKPAGIDRQMLLFLYGAAKVIPEPTEGMLEVLDIVEEHLFHKKEPNGNPKA